MATGGDGELTGKQIVLLGSAISSVAIESIAEGYLKINNETVVSLRQKNQGKHEGLVKDLIRHWAYKNSGPDQVKVGVTFNEICKGGFE